MKYYKVRIWNSFGKSWEIITYLAFSDEYLAELKKEMDDETDNNAVIDNYIDELGSFNVEEQCIAEKALDENRSNNNYMPYDLETKHTYDEITKNEWIAHGGYIADDELKELQIIWTN